jgi:hypothetical protein
MTDRKPLMGIQVYNFDVPAPDGELVELVPQLGIEFTLAPLNWGNVETQPGVFDWSAIDWWEGLEKALGSVPERIWTIYPLHMNERGALPPDLVKEPLDSKLFLDRWAAFIRASAERIGWGEGSLIMIGNEVDTFFQSHPEEVAAANTFLEKSVDIVHDIVPGSRVMHTINPVNLKDERIREFTERINQHTDVVGYNWYDIRDNFRVDQLSDLRALVAEWVASCNGKQMVISEIGIPTGQEGGSSDEMQAERVRELFDVVDSYPRDQVLGAIWLGLDDWPVETLREWVKHQFPGFAGDGAFLSFLVTLGLRRNDKTPKAGFVAWEERARSTGRARAVPAGR